MNTFAKIAGALALSWFAAGATAETIAPTTGSGIVQLSELDGLTNITCLAGETVRANKATSNNPITIEGNVYESGVGTHATSVCVVELNGAKTFHCIVGVDDAADQKANHGIFEYVVTLYGSSETDATEKARGTLNRQTDARSAEINLEGLEGYTYLKLEALQGDQAWADHVDWADARFTYEGEVPAIIPAGLMFQDSMVSLPETGANGAEIVPLSSLDLSLCTNGWGTVKADKSIDGNPLTLKGVIYESGVGLHATAMVVVQLNGAVTGFHAVLGIDDEANNEGNCNYDVYIVKNNYSQTSVAQGTIKRADTEAVAVDINGFAADDKYLVLEFDKGVNNSNDHVDIANAYFEYVEQNSNRPVTVSPDVLDVNLQAATAVFSQPGVKFMQKVRCSNPDAVITASNLPEGLTFNAERNLIEGIVKTEGTYTYTVSIALGEETKNTEITLTVSNSLQQPTPMMGWISWNVVGRNISGNIVKQTADAFVSNGLVDAGYNYLCIDDCWHADARGDDGYPVEHPSKFPEGMKAVGDYVHSKGLKFGIYSDVAARTCDGKFGSHGYYDKDAEKYNEWGVDIVKVDYCGAPGDVATAIERYGTFGNELKKYDITLFVCEWGQREPWKWAAQLGSPVWRATYDVRDCWQGVNGGIGVLQSIEGMKNLWLYNGVNRWNDADMLVTAIHGKGQSSSDLCLKAGMTQDEYRTQFALWAMWSSPMMLSFDLRNPITDDDLSIMTNPEMIALNQDRMGQAAEPLMHDPATFFVLAKDLENGDVAVSVTNLSDKALDYTIDFANVPGMNPETAYNVRDVEHRTDAEPASDGQFVCKAIPSHATAVYRFSAQGTDGIAEIGASKAMENMTVEVNGSTVNVCLPGTDGASKRILLSDVQGRVLGATTTDAECAALAAPAAPGVYVVNAICAGRSVSQKITL